MRTRSQEEIAGWAFVAWAANVLDWVFTKIALSKGAYEANPLVEGWITGYWGLTAKVLGVGALLSVLILRYWRVRIVQVSMPILAGFYALVAFWGLLMASGTWQ